MQWERREMNEVIDSVRFNGKSQYQKREKNLSVKDFTTKQVTF